MHKTFYEAHQDLSEALRALGKEAAHCLGIYGKWAWTKLKQGFNWLVKLCKGSK